MLPEHEKLLKVRSIGWLKCLKQLFYFIYFLVFNKSHFYMGVYVSFLFQFLYSKLWEFLFCPSQHVASHIECWMAKAAVWIFVILSPHTLPVNSLSVLWLNLLWRLRHNPDHSFFSDSRLHGYCPRCCSLRCGALGKSSPFPCFCVCVCVRVFGWTEEFLEVPQVLTRTYS